MEENTFFVKLGTEDAALLISESIAQKGGECIDTYFIASPPGGCTVLVYEKYFFRAQGKVTLTVVIDDFQGKTRLHYASSGGGYMADDDLGAGEKLVSVVLKRLKPYLYESDQC